MLGLILNVVVVALFAALLIIGLSMRLPDHVPRAVRSSSMPDGTTQALTHSQGFTAMSTIDTAYNLPQAGALPAHALVRDVRAELGPWGFWGSLGWGLFAAAAGVVRRLRLHDHLDADASSSVSPILRMCAFSTVTGIATLTAPIVVLVIAVKIRKFSLRDYFALDGFTRRDLVLGHRLPRGIDRRFQRNADRCSESTADPNTSKRAIGRPRLPVCCR